MITRLLGIMCVLTGCATAPESRVNFQHQAWQQLQQVRHSEPTQAVVHAPDIRIVSPQGRPQFRVRP